MTVNCGNSGLSAFLQEELVTVLFVEGRSANRMEIAERGELLAAAIGEGDEELAAALLREAPVLASYEDEVGGEKVVRRREGES